MDRSQLRGLLLPLILIVIGAVALLANLNVLSADALARLADLWPLILVVIGLQFVYNRAFPPRTALAAGTATLVVVLAAEIGRRIAERRLGALDG